MQRMSLILEKALAILQRDQAAAYFRLTSELDGMPVQVVVNDESFVVDCHSSRVQIIDPSPDIACPAMTATDRRTVLDLCDGEVRILEAVMSGRLHVRGREDHLLRMSRAVTAFSEGAVRARRMRALLDDFRADFSSG